MTKNDKQILGGSVALLIAIIIYIVYKNRQEEEKYDAMIPKDVTQLELLDKVTGDKVAFGNKVLFMADELNVNPNHLMAIMDYESAGTFKANIWGGYNGKYVGLIQFGSAAAKDLGTTQAYLSSLSNVAQLDYVLKYFKLWNSRIFPHTIKSFADLYLAVLYPGAIKITDNNYNLGSKYSALAFPNQARNLYQNGVISKNTITMAYNKRYPFLNIA